MFRHIEFYLWGLIPAVVGVASVFVSLHCAVKGGWMQKCAAVLVAIVVIFSLWILKRIFVDGAWPIYLPHILLVGTALISGIQWGMRHRLLKKPGIR